MNSVRRVSFDALLLVVNFAFYILAFALAHISNHEVIVFSLFFIQTMFAVFLKFSAAGVSSPVFVFSIFNFLYGTWYFIFLFLTKGYDSSAVIDALRLSMLAGLALTCGCLVAFFLKKPIDILCNVKMWGGARVFYSFNIFIVLMIMVFSVGTGASSKTDLQDNLGSLHSILLICSLIVTYVIFIFCFEHLRSLASFSKWLAPVFIIFLFLMLLTGERDLMFRFLLFAFIIFYDVNRIPAKRKFIFLLVCAVILLPITQALKAVFFSSEISLSYGVASIFFGEFSSASRNLYLVLLNDNVDLYPPFALFSDLGRGLLPMSSALGYESSVSWFHNVFRPYIGLAGESGWGLGLVVQGYLLGGTVGVFVLFTTIGFLLGISFSYRNKSVYLYVFYLIFLSSVVYCLRADIANLVSSVFKIGALSLFFIFVINRPFFIRSSGE